MCLRKVAYHLGLRAKSLAPRFHISRMENLALPVTRIAYSRSAPAPKAARAEPYNQI
jgi:hypothetical protein